MREHGLSFYRKYYSENQLLTNDDAFKLKYNLNELIYMTVNQTKIYIVELLEENKNYCLYKVVDVFEREYLLKEVRYQPVSSYLTALTLLMNKSCVAFISEYEVVDDKILIIYEYCQKIDVHNINPNYLKRRFHQILTVVYVLHKVGLHFSCLKLSDFCQTQNGFRLFHLENTLRESNNVSEITLESTAPLLSSLIEHRRMTIDPNLYKTLQKIIEKARSTECVYLEDLLNSPMFKVKKRVIIEPSERAFTPDPHDLIPMRHKVHHYISGGALWKTDPDLDPSSTKMKIITIYMFIGVFLPFISFIHIQTSRLGPMSFASLANKITILGITVCGSLLLATVRDEDKDIYYIEQMAKLRNFITYLCLFSCCTLFIKILESKNSLLTLSLTFHTVIWIIFSLFIKLES